MRSKFSGILAVLKTVSIQIAEEELVLMAEKCLYWPTTCSLVISDLHLGKSSHFRKSGIPLSMGSYKDDLESIHSLIKKLDPKKIIFLGDLFHSDHNVEWEIFSEWVKQHKDIEFVLVEGNHDLLSTHTYTIAGIRVVESYRIGKICLSHEPLENLKEYNIHGHIHPGVRLVGKAKQSIRIPCFYIGQKQMVLPAFGSLTGLYIIEPKQHETIYGIANLSLIKFAVAE